MFLEIEIGRRRLDPAPRVLDEKWQRTIPIGTDHETHVPCALEYSRAKALRHTPRDAENRVLLHAAFHFAEPAHHSLFGVLADCAGIHKDDVGRFRRVHLIVPERRERSEYQLGIAHVHLASIGLDVDCRALLISHAVGKDMR